MYYFLCNIIFSSNDLEITPVYSFISSFFLYGVCSLLPGLNCHCHPPFALTLLLLPPSPTSEARLSIISRILFPFLLKPPKPWFLPECFLCMSTSLVLTTFCFLAFHFSSCHVIKWHVKFYFLQHDWVLFLGKSSLIISQEIKIEIIS